MPKSHTEKIKKMNRVSSMSIGTETRDSIQPSGIATQSGFGEFCPEFQDVQKLAYELHEQKGGSDFENWLEAENILKEQHQQGEAA